MQQVGSRCFLFACMAEALERSKPVLSMTYCHVQSRLLRLFTQQTYYDEVASQVHVSSCAPSPHALLDRRRKPSPPSSRYVVTQLCYACACMQQPRPACATHQGSAHSEEISRQCAFHGDCLSGGLWAGHALRASRPAHRVAGAAGRHTGVLLRQCHHHRRAILSDRHPNSPLTQKPSVHFLRETLNPTP